jgi:signal peptidase I
VSDSVTLSPRAGNSFTDEHRAAALAKVNRRRGRLGRFLWEWIKSFQLAIVAFLVVRAFLVEAFKIPSGSMENTLLVGDFLLVNKLVYGAEIPFVGKRLPGLRPPRFGDVVVFQWPQDPSRNMVKRLVGEPGDTLAMRDGWLLRNGTKVEEPYVRHGDLALDGGAEDFRWQRDYLVRTAQATMSYSPSRNNWGPIVVPPRNYFVLGDNRDNSLDSRYWGFVPDTLIRGKPLIIYYSYRPDSSSRESWLARVRWHRIGTRVH